MRNNEGEKVILYRTKPQQTQIDKWPKAITVAYIQVVGGCVDFIDCRLGLRMSRHSLKELLEEQDEYREHGLYIGDQRYGSDPEDGKSTLTSAQCGTLVSWLNDELSQAKAQKKQRSADEKGAEKRLAEEQQKKAQVEKDNALLREQQLELKRSVEHLEAEVVELRKQKDRNQKPLKQLRAKHQFILQTIRQFERQMAEVRRVCPNQEDDLNNLLDTLVTNLKNELEQFPQAGGSRHDRPVDIIREEP